MSEIRRFYNHVPQSDYFVASKARSLVFMLIACNGFQRRMPVRSVTLDQNIRLRDGEVKEPPTRKFKLANWFQPQTLQSGSRNTLNVCFVATSEKASHGAKLSGRLIGVYSKLRLAVKAHLEHGWAIASLRAVARTFIPHGKSLPASLAILAKRSLALLRTCARIPLPITRKYAELIEAARAGERNPFVFSATLKRAIELPTRRCVAATGTSRARLSVSATRLDSAGAAARASNTSANARDSAINTDHRNCDTLSYSHGAFSELESVLVRAVRVLIAPLRLALFYHRKPDEMRALIG